MTQKRLLIVALIVIVAASGFNGFLGLHALGRVNGEQHRLAASNASGLTAQKASAVARISTVQQRCELTRELVAIIDRHDAAGARQLSASLAVCEQQLVQVKVIAAETPGAPAGHAK